MRTQLPFRPTHHDHTGDPVQQERGIDLAKESEQEPLALALRGQLLGTKTAADIQPGGLWEAVPQVAPKQTLGTTTLPPGCQPACQREVFYLYNISLNSVT